MTARKKPYHMVNYHKHENGVTAYCSCGWEEETENDDAASDATTDHFKANIYQR